MQSLSRLFRNRRPGRLAITVVPGGQPSPGAVGQVFKLLDERHLPATWAVATGRGKLPLADRLLVSRSPHEIAYFPRSAELADDVPGLEAQHQIAQRVEVPLATFVSRKAGVHPSLLARLGVVALVPAGVRSRTGQVRSVAWGIWEAPCTDLLSHFSAETRGAMQARLNQALRGSVNLHLVWRIEANVQGESERTAVELLDMVAELSYRNWLVVEPIAVVARAETRRLASAA